MENASKALIMAAGVLIGIMVLSIAVYLFATFGTRSAELHRQIDDDRLNQFNTQFTSYELNNEITIYDVISVANLAKQSNINNGFETIDTSANSFYVSVSVKTSNNTSYTNIEAKTQSWYEQNLISPEKYMTVDNGEEPPYQTLPTYKCTVEINPVTGRVNNVKFEIK